MKFLRYVLTLLALSSSTVHADYAPYGGRHEIAIDGMNGSFHHVHNWAYDQRSKPGALFNDSSPSAHERFFSDANDFSFVEYTNRQGNSLFRSPSPAFSKLWISPYDDYVVGMSNIKLNNPYQLVVWTIDGKLVHKERIRYKHPYGGVSESVTNWVTWFDNQVKLDIKHTKADSNLIISRPNLEDIVIPLAGPMECKTIKQTQSYRCRNFIFDRY